MPDLFDPIDLRGTTIRNRVMLSPMCQYSCETNGVATDWHHVHLGSRAVGGAGLVMTEAAAVSPRGRISPNDLGIWSAEHADALVRTTDFIRQQGGTPAIQLAHAGRKASKRPPFDGGDPIHGEGGWVPVGPAETPYPYDDPLATDPLDADGIRKVVDSFREAAERALEAGFEVAEVHAAHGYLLHEFYSPVTNTREDEYGGDFEGRTRLLREVTREVREVWPADKPVAVRVSATDWMGDDAWTIDETVRLAPHLADLGVDLLDVSAGGIHPDQQLPRTGPHYQVPYAEAVRESDPGLAVAAVGGISTPEGAAAVVENGRADIAALAREHLRNPYFTLHAASELGRADAVDVPKQYRRGF